MEHYPKLTKEITAAVKELNGYIPDALHGFSTMAKSAKKEGVLDMKTKELIAMAIAVAARCEGCIGYHAEELVELGATKQELAEMLGMAVYMGGGPSLMYAAEALVAYNQFSEEQK